MFLGMWDGMDFGGTRICEFKVCGVSEAHTLPNEKRKIEHKEGTVMPVFLSSFTAFTSQNKARVLNIYESL